LTDHQWAHTINLILVSMPFKSIFLTFDASVETSHDLEKQYRLDYSYKANHQQIQTGCQVLTSQGMKNFINERLMCEAIMRSILREITEKTIANLNTTISALGVYCGIGGEMVSTGTTEA